MPESVRNRPSRATEDIFLFAKTSKYYYNNQAVRERSGANLRNYYWTFANCSPLPLGEGQGVRVWSNQTNKANLFAPNCPQANPLLGA